MEAQTDQEPKPVKGFEGLGNQQSRRQKNTGGEIPRGIERSVTPGAPDAWLTALEKYGTMTFEQVIKPALELAEDGFPVSSVVSNFIGRSEETGEGDIRGWKSTTSIFMPKGRAPKTGETLVQSALAKTFRRLIEVERANAHRGRADAIRAARDYIYKGDIADEMAAFSDKMGGLFTVEDFNDFSVKIDKPVVGKFREFEVYTCGPWCQGPVTAQTLQILEDDDLQAMGHNSPDYMHLVSQALNLSFADRHYYYGDPDFVDVPMDGLMTKEYARARRSMIDMDKAFPEMPPPGEPCSYQGTPDKNLSAQKLTPVPGEQEQDTSYTCVVDKWGNACSATPSDGVFGTPIVDGLGFIISGRGSQNWLDPDHASSLQPWKRPRLTPNPAMAFKNGKLFMPFGTPGGDAQCPAMLQLFLNVTQFGMDPQRAIEQPRFMPWNSPNSFWPHTYLPGRMDVEGRVSGDSAADLEKRGHEMRVINDWSPSMGALSGIVIDGESGVLKGGADPRRDTYAIGR